MITFYWTLRFDDLGCVGDWKNKNYIFNITKFNEIIPKVKQGVHIVSNIKEEFETKFKDYGLVTLGMDTTIIKEQINKLGKIMKGLNFENIGDKFLEVTNTKEWGELQEKFNDCVDIFVLGHGGNLGVD